MSIDQSLINISLLHFAVLLSFALAILFTLKFNNKRPSILWAVANIMSSFAMVNPSIFVETQSSSEYNLFGFILSGTALFLPYFALASGQGKIVHFHKSVPIFCVAVVTMMIAAFLPYGWLPSVMGYWSGAVIAFATAWVGLKNRYWRGLWGRGILISSLCACGLVLLWRGWVLFDGRDGVGFSIDPAMSLLQLQLMVATGFFIQVGFFAMIGAREHRFRRFAGRRAARIFEIGSEMEHEAGRLAAIAAERLFTLELLTHEVRQPINNAQAALQALDAETSAGTRNMKQVKNAIGRAQSVLDSINLSISNAILGVTLLEKDHPVASRSMNAHDLADLAKFDCPIDHAPRITLGSEDTSIYVDIDPILVRLALRNLLDNALKYSPAASAVQLDIIRREDRFGVSFTVTSQLSRPDLLNQDIFTQRSRGSGAREDGSGLGLFLVKKVAKMHHGTISYAVHDQNTVIFDLFFPD
jgi:signal transduction histidine kinase